MLRTLRDVIVAQIECNCTNTFISKVVFERSQVWQCDALCVIVTTRNPHLWIHLLCRHETYRPIVCSNGSFDNCASR